MAGELNWAVENDIHGYFVTCQRPIVIRIGVYNDLYPPAHLRGLLFIEDPNNPGEFINTDIQMNGYRDDATTELDHHYTFNLAEYCSNFFKDAPAFYSQNWCDNFYTMLYRKFFLKIYPVSQQEDGSLDTDWYDELRSDIFTVTETNTMVTESNSSADDYIRLDKFVQNGNNDSGLAWPASPWNRLMTNMPDYQPIDARGPAFMFYPFLLRGYQGRTTSIEIMNAQGTIAEIETNGYEDRHIALHIHPVILELWLFLNANPNLGMLVDFSSNPATEWYQIRLLHKDSTGAVIRTSPPKRYKIVDGFGTCQQYKTFVFKNMRGNFDWFTALGTQTKETQLSGTEFDRHTDFSVSAEYGNGDFGILRGQHSRTNLWNKRKQVFSVFSQPLSKDEVDWLEELIVSPLVWITQNITDIDPDKSIANFNRSGLVAVNILKGSYKMHTTEKNRHYIEFKYTLSENTIVQKN